MTTTREAGQTGAALARDTALYTLGIAATRFANLLLLPLYLSMLSREAYGALGVLEQLVQVLVMITMAGGMEALVKIGTDLKSTPEAQMRLVSTMTTWMVVVGLTVAALTALLWPWLGPALGGIALVPMGAIALAGVSGSAAFQALSAHLQVRGESRRHTAYSALRTVLNVVIAVPLLVFTDLGVSALLIAAASSFWAGTVLLLAHLRRQAGGFQLVFDVELLKRTLSYGVPLLPHLVAAVVFQAADKFMLAASDAHGLQDVGVYSVGSRISSGVMMLGLGLQRAWLPWFFQEANRTEDTPGRWDRVRRLSFWSMAGMASAVAGLGLMAPELVDVIAPEAYAGAALITSVLCLSTLVRTGAQMAGSVVLNSASAYRIWLASVPAALINVGLIWLAIPRYGAMGAAWATTAGMTLNMLFTVVLSRATLAVPFRYGAIAVLLVVVGALVLFTGELPWFVRLPLCAVVPVVAAAFDIEGAREVTALVTARMNRFRGRR